MQSPVNITVRVYNYPEASKVPEKKLERTEQKAQEVAQEILSGSKRVVVSTVKLSKKLFVKLIRDLLPALTLKVIKSVPGILMMAVA